MKTFNEFLTEDIDIRRVNQHQAKIIRAQNSTIDKMRRQAIRKKRREGAINTVASIARGVFREYE